MKQSRKSAAKTRLFRKLKALRVTLANDEREILDGLVAEDEVEAHKIRSKNLVRASSKKESKLTEVNAHKIRSKQLVRTPSKESSRANEVTAHKIRSKQLVRVPSKESSRANEVTAHSVKMSKNPVKQPAKKEFPIDTNIEESRAD